MELLDSQTLKQKIHSVLTGGSILFIVPPFSRSSKGAYLDPHSLQALATEKGYKTDILYLNVLLASIAGTNICERVGQAPRFWMLGERLFARSAHPEFPPLGKTPELCWDEALSISGNHADHVKTHYDTENFFHQPSYSKLEEICHAFINEAMAVINHLDYDIIWTTVGWQQNNCAAAIAKRIKEHNSQTVTLIGGMQCEEEIAEGIASLSPHFDYVFSGEIETAFIDFLDNYEAGRLPSEQIIIAPPVQDLDALPQPNYDPFFNQVDCFYDHQPPDGLMLAYESSRGCWKGHKNRCAFCGLNSDDRIRHRYKSAQKTAKELTHLTYRHPEAAVFMVDHIIPASYYRDLPPLLNPRPGCSIRYELLPTLTLKDLINLKNSGIKRIQPGIEALSTNLLKLMHKGIPAGRNLQVLREALSTDIFVFWYLLWGFPGDKKEDYEATLALLPLIRHLQPPAIFAHIRFERFSDYVEEPEAHHIRNLRPWAAYDMVFPETVDIPNLANVFTGEYPSDSHDNPELIQQLMDEVDLWKQSWRQVTLNIVFIADFYCIYDTRKLTGQDKTFPMDKNRAKEVMTQCAYTGSPNQQWAVEQKIAVVMDDTYVPLVTGSPELLIEFAS